MRRHHTKDLHEFPFSLDIEEDNLSEEQKKLLHAMLLRHVGAFSLGDDDLGYIDSVKHGIPLAAETPIRIPHHRVLPNLQQEVCQHLELDTARHYQEEQESLCIPGSSSEEEDRNC